MKKFVVILAVIFSQMALSQEKGRIKGKLLDKEMNNEPLSFASVILKGTTTGVETDLEGDFSISVAPGNYTVVFSFLGYQSLEVAVVVKAGETVTVNRTLEAAQGVALDEVKVTATTSKEKTSALIIEQKKAISIETKIGAQELSKKGVSDATGAVAKTAGVVKGSKNVVVRGLGDRYNSTSLNGLPLPSEDPEYKNISLDFFDTSVIKNIGVNKVFNSSIIGDVGGANINIESKELTKRKTGSISFSTGGNSQTVSKDFLTIDGTNRFGTGNGFSIPVSSLTQYSFSNSWKPNTQNFQSNNSISFSVGRKFDVGEEGKLSLFLIGGHSGNYNFTEGNIKQTNSTGDIYQDQNFDKYEYNVSQILMGNVKYKFPKGHELAYNHLFIHNNKQSIGDYFGTVNPEQTGDLEFQRRQQVNDNNLFVNQFLGKFILSERYTLEGKASLNFIQGNEPDRRTNKYLFRDNFYSPQTNSAGENERYFSKLQELDNNAYGKLTYKLNEDEEDISILEVGGHFRYTERLFSATIFNHGFNTRVPIDVNDPDAVFSQNNLDSGVFSLQTGRGGINNPFAFDPFTYRGKRLIQSGFGNLVYQLNENLIVSGGIRLESVQQRVTYSTNIANSDTSGASKINEFYVLPSMNVKYNFNENSILRLAGSVTYTMPQFKETAPFKYQDVSFSSQGNPNLIPSDNYNFDAKYEYYFSSSELITVTGFYKYIQNPISRSEIPSGGNTLTYLNVGNDASVFGIELEARKNLLKSDEEAELEYSFDAGLNTSFLSSKVNLDQASVAQFTNSSSNLEGATPFLINADISFNKQYKNSELTSSLVFNYFSERVYSIGTRGFENILEKGIPTLDIVSSLKLGEKYNLKFKAQNLLNPAFQLSRDGANGGSNVVLGNYKKGVNLSLGVTYDF
ncbi:TonB-dependent receptor [Pseudotenacibaculum sp. MALMAid0570]|uniref:TonB-dependent receptor n=1 Tax=Pseudotenacibaculum sp. MALMAid0570 TaxID=3143938 RepID=UPI0032DEB3F3